MSKLLSVSESYKWDEATDEFIYLPTNERSSASVYGAKVEVYASRVCEWFLDVANELVSKKSSPGDYVALSVALAYIEGVQQYREGGETDSSKARFTRSGNRIFPEVPDNVLERLYKEARCGLFHSGFTDGCTYLNYGNPSPLAVDGENLNINPQLFVEEVVIDFEAYISELLHSPNSQLAKNFEKLWDDRWENS